MPLKLRDPPDLSHAVLSRLELWETFPANSQVVPRYTGVIRVFPQAASTQPQYLHGQVFAQPCLEAQRERSLAWHCQCSAAEGFPPLGQIQPLPKFSFNGQGEGMHVPPWCGVTCSYLVLYHPRLNYSYFSLLKEEFRAIFIVVGLQLLISEIFLFHC